MRKFIDFNQIRRIWRPLGVGSIFGLLLALIFLAGFFIRDLIDLHGSNTLAGTATQERYQLLAEVSDLLDIYYLRELPTPKELEYAAIRGMLAGLGDRNTFFIDPPVAQSESHVLAGTYGGIGASIRRNEQGDIVLTPFQGSPAEAAGIQDGDILVSVNGEIFDNAFALDAIDQMLRGEVKEGSGVQIEFIRNGRLYSTFVEFNVINVPSVLWRVSEINDKVGILQILRFTNRTPEELRSALNALLQQSAVDALVLDLRNNSGGLLQESIISASLFLESDHNIVYQVTNQGERAFAAESEQPVVDIPLVILVNNGTASAAELVAGAIRDHDRGILVGQQTFGKGTIQQIFPLSDSSSVHITSAEWITPDRHKLDGVGLDPDIEVTPDVDGRDIEIIVALDYLQSILETE